VPVAERLAVTSAAPLTASLLHATQIYYVRAVATATDFDRRSASAVELSRSLKVRSASSRDSVNTPPRSRKWGDTKLAAVAVLILDRFFFKILSTLDLFSSKFAAKIRIKDPTTPHMRRYTTL